ncbi:unnamed protein product, partial [Pelagomonas calceolata]
GNNIIRHLGARRQDAVEALLARRRLRVLRQILRRVAVPDRAHELLARGRADGRHDVLRRGAERARHPLAADALAGEREHEVLDGAGAGGVVLEAELLRQIVLGSAGDDEPLRHALGGLAFLLVETAQLGFGLRAGGVEAPRLRQEVVRRLDRCLQRFGRRVRGNRFVRVLGYAAACLEGVESPDASKNKCQSGGLHRLCKCASYYMYRLQFESVWQVDYCPCW